MNHTMTAPLTDPVAPGRDEPTRHPLDLGQLALGLALAGLLPIPGPAASLAAIVCGLAARRARSPQSRSAAWAAVALGAFQIAGPLLALFVYCVVLGYPFPIHRYHG